MKALRVVLLIAAVVAVLALSSCGQCKHANIDKLVVSEASCVNDGVLQSVCRDCGGIVNIDKVAKLPHTEEIVAAIEPTCESYGSTEGKRCTTCGIVLEGEELSPLGHDYSSVTIVKPAACTEDGSEVMACNLCGDVKFRTLAKHGHKANPTVIENYVYPTCTEDGSYSEVVYCSVCNVKIRSAEVILDALGHNYANGVCVVCMETDPDYAFVKETYSISVKTIGGLGLADITYGIYDGDNLKAYGKTDQNGMATVKLFPYGNYTVELSTSSLDGYNVEARYPFVQRTANIVLSSSVIADSDLTGVKYELGDVMRDFTVTTTDGETFTLSEVLKTKKAVLINFWFSTCSPCINEFPFMDSAYQKYQDDIAVIAINDFAFDNAEVVKIFQASMGLTIPLAKDYSQLGTAFDIKYYPTSIIVDRYGTICLIEIGGLASEVPYVVAFEYFTSDDYEQKLFESIEAIPCDHTFVDGACTVCGEDNPD